MRAPAFRALHRARHNMHRVCAAGWLPGGRQARSGDCTRCLSACGGAAEQPPAGRRPAGATSKSHHLCGKALQRSASRSPESRSADHVDRVWSTRHTCPCRLDPGSPPDRQGHVPQGLRTRGMPSRAQRRRHAERPPPQRAPRQAAHRRRRGLGRPQQRLQCACVLESFELVLVHFRPVHMGKGLRCACQVLVLSVAISWRRMQLLQSASSHLLAACASSKHQRRRSRCPKCAAAGQRGARRRVGVAAAERDVGRIQPRAGQPGGFVRVARLPEDPARVRIAVRFICLPEDPTCARTWQPGLPACRRTLRARMAASVGGKRLPCSLLRTCAPDRGRAASLALGGLIAPLCLSGQQNHPCCPLHVVNERRVRGHDHAPLAGGAPALHGCQLAEALAVSHCRKKKKKRGGAPGRPVRVFGKHACTAPRLKDVLTRRVLTGGLAGLLSCHSAEDTGALAAQRSAPRGPERADVLVAGPPHPGTGTLHARAPRGLPREAHSQAAQHGAPERLRVFAGRRVEQRQVARRVAGAPARPGLGALAGQAPSRRGAAHRRAAGTGRACSGPGTERG